MHAFAQVTINWESLYELKVIVIILLHTKKDETSTQMPWVLFFPAWGGKNVPLHHLDYRKKNFKNIYLRLQQ